MGKETLLTIEEAADWLAISAPTLRRMIRRGEIPTIKISQRTVRLKLQDILDYIEEHHERRKI